MSKLVVYGGAGALGRALVQHFKTKGYVKYFRKKKSQMGHCYSIGYHSHVLIIPSIRP